MNSPPPSRPKFYRSLQAGRGVAALMVVLYHWEGICSLPKYWHWPHYFFYFGARGVEFFFVLSGIVLFQAHQHDLGRPGRWAGYAWKRFRRIYPIYWVTLFTLLPLYFLEPAFGRGFERQAAVILDSILLLPVTTVNTTIPVAWTLEHEVMFYLVFSLLFLSRKLGTAALSLWMLGSVLTLLHPLNNAVASAFLSPQHLLFGLGILVAIAARRIHSSGRALSFAGILGFAVCCALDDLARPTTSWLPIVYGVFAAVAALGLMLIENAGNLRVPNLLVGLGEVSYSLYLIHCAVLSVCAKLLYSMWLNGTMPLPLAAVILLTLALTAGVLAHLFVERPLLRLFARQPRTGQPLPSNGPTPPHLPETPEMIETPAHFMASF